MSARSKTASNRAVPMPCPWQSVRTMMPRPPACRRRGLDSTVSMTRPSTVLSGDTATRTCRPCPGWRRSSSIRRGRSEGREAACSNTPGIRRSAVIPEASSGPAGRMAEVMVRSPPDECGPSCTRPHSGRSAPWSCAAGPPVQSPASHRDGWLARCRQRPPAPPAPA